MAGIVSIGWHVPQHRESASEVAKRCEVSPQALANFGLRAKGVPGPEDHPSTLAACAVEHALAAAELDSKSIELLIFAGVTRDLPGPWVAAFGVLAELGATQAAGFDLSCRCPGFTEALWVAASLIRGGSFRNIVVCTGDRFDHLISESKAKHTIASAVYSAGGCAVVLGADAKNSIVARAHATIGDLSVHDVLCPPAGGTRRALDHTALEQHAHLIGKDPTIAQAATVREFRRRSDRQNLESVCKQAGFEQIDFIVGSALDVRDEAESLRELGIGPDRYLMSLPDYGHIGPASSIVALGNAIREGRRVGPRLVIHLKTLFYCSTIGIRGVQDDLGICISGPNRAAPPRDSHAGES